MVETSLWLELYREAMRHTKLWQRFRDGPSWSLQICSAASDGLRLLVVLQGHYESVTSGCQGYQRTEERGMEVGQEKTSQLGFLPEFSSISWDYSVQIRINLWLILWFCGMLKGSQLTIFPALPWHLWRNMCVEAFILSFGNSLRKWLDFKYLKQIQQKLPQILIWGVEERKTQM